MTKQLQPYLSNIRKDIDQQARWIAADRGPAQAIELLRRVAEYAERKRRELESAEIKSKNGKGEEV